MRKINKINELLDRLLELKNENDHPNFAFSQKQKVIDQLRKLSVNRRESSRNEEA